MLTLDADACVLAIGQKPDLSFLKPADGVELTPGGTIRVDPASLATSAAGVYAGGDVAFGPRNLIEAVANGKLAARSIHEHLAKEHAGLEVTLEVEKLPTRDYRMLAGFEVLDRETPPTLDLGRRTGIAEVETGYEKGAAVRQAARCLVCHVQTIYDPEKCVLCSRCVDVCPEYCLAIVPFESLDLPEAERAELEARAEANGLPLSAMIKDDDRCIRCGLCAVRCPTDAMTMEKFQILERFARRCPQGDRMTEEKKDRREFLVKIGIGAGVVGIGTQAAASLRSLLPNVSYDAPTTVKLGLPADFPDGMKFLPEQRLFVFREGKVFHAVSAVCTHLGCTVRAEALPQPETMEVGGAPMRVTHRFACPCHGSKYTGDGKVVSGPAPKALAWYHLTVSTDDGQLVVDLANEVGRDFRLTVA